MTFDRHLPLDERIQRIDHIQARRYSKLTGLAVEIATEGILQAQEQRLRQAGAPATALTNGIETVDPWGTKLRLIKV